MTFEEFFAKKKIDIDQLAKADQKLYTEFKSHFVLMGEKSFDHSKKFWFNKLRRLYHLQQPVKEAITQVETRIASQAEPLSSPTIEQTPVVTSSVKPPAFKPRFKAANVPAKTETAAEATEQKGVAASETAPAQAKKPPFKPRNIKPVSGELSDDAQTVESRPGQTEVSDTPVTNPAAAVPSAQKPAYKPKFNIRNIPKKPAGAEEQTGHTAEEKAVPDLSDKSEKSTKQTNDEVLNVPETAGKEEAKAKPAYKPRFNVKNIPKKADVKEEDNSAKEPQETSAVTERTDLSQPLAGTGETAEGADASTADKPAKPVYKPRFSAKNIKPKTED